MSLRILGGVAKGRTFSVPDSARPSGVRVRKSLFDLLAVRQPEGRFLDLHGGSGAIALEAASRGYTVTVTERDAAAVRTLTGNARALGLRPQILAGDALALLPKLGTFDVVFSDPPYGQDIPALTVRLLRLFPVVPGGLLVAQHPTQVELPEERGYTLERRRYGSNVLSLYTRDPA
ncbi:RsmD family RNA methyltransferase [Deinococcus sonorensis]|uniref:RsmD family RNA methyltransferase n=2 Tax=Deinococcus sonorensis TaxID=309891 RepID=A0AAU7U8H1_9DEIO